MSEEETVKPEPETITLKITLPTKEKVVKALESLFPGITVEVKGEEKKEEKEE